MARPDRRGDRRLEARLLAKKRAWAQEVTRRATRDFLDAVEPVLDELGMARGSVLHGIGLRAGEVAWSLVQRGDTAGLARELLRKHVLGSLDTATPERLDALADLLDHLLVGLVDAIRALRRREPWRLGAIDVSAEDVVSFRPQQTSLLAALIDRHVAESGEQSALRLELDEVLQQLHAVVREVEARGGGALSETEEPPGGD